MSTEFETIMRCSAGTLPDIIGLLDVVGLETPDEAIAFAADFYPEATISGRLRLGVRELWRFKGQSTNDKGNDPPAYLGRGRQPPQGGVQL